MSHDHAHDHEHSTHMHPDNLGPQLEPFAARLRWRVSSEIAQDEWRRLLCRFLEILAAGCAASGPCVIGHLKLMAIFPDGGAVRASAVSAAHAALSDTLSPAAPADRAQITLNVLVYGLPGEELERLSRSAAQRLCVEHPLEIIWE